MLIVPRPSREELREAMCDEKVDRVPGDPETSIFKSAARLHQSRWRAARGLPMGTDPMLGGRTARPMGSRLPVELARQTGANFLDSRIAGVVARRLGKPEKHQQLEANRLYANLLSSMPMCFNLFGTVSEPARATRAVKAWWPDTPGRVTDVCFEWSPGRRDPAFLGNGTSFDVAFVLELEDGKKGLLAVETKYHEHPTPPSKPHASLRYEAVSRQSGVLDNRHIELLRADACAQIWLDHLLALSMLQHPSGEWGWVRFVLVYADANPTWPRLARTYQGMLAERSSFATKTFDELLAANALDVDIRDKLVERYRCWSAAEHAGSDRGAARVPETVR